MNSACSVAVETDRQQCITDNDCARRGSEFTGSICRDFRCEAPPATPWSCLGNPPSVVPVGGEVTAILNFKDLVSYQPIPGVLGTVCRKLDITCAQPLATDLKSDNLGKMTVTVPLGFDGYVRLTATEAMAGSYFFNPPLTKNREIPLIPILRMTALEGFAQQARAQVLPDRGQLVLGVYDCLDTPAEGVTLSSTDADALTKPFYMVKMLPSTTATATDSAGYGGILNLVPGSVTVTGTLASGQVIGTESVLTRAGELTYTSLVPRSR